MDFQDVSSRAQRPKKTNPHQLKINMSTPLKFNIDPENGGWKTTSFLLGFGNFSGAMSC